MTAIELIRQLKELSPDTRIVVRGYEDGYNDILTLISRSIKLNREAEWYLGEYMDSKDADSISAIELFGENTND